MRRFSKRRECILKNLEGRTDHPTAEMVYSSVKEEIPNISLGTVYRNLKELSSERTILSFTLNGKEHFDWKNLPHLHLCCNICGTIEDYPLPYVKHLSLADEKPFDVRNVIVQGICHDCLEKQSQE